MRGNCIIPPCEIRNEHHRPCDFKISTLNPVKFEICTINLVILKLAQETLSFYLIEPISPCLSI